MAISIISSTSIPDSLCQEAPESTIQFLAGLSTAWLRASGHTQNPTRPPQTPPEGGATRGVPQLPQPPAASAPGTSAAATAVRLAVYRAWAQMAGPESGGVRACWGQTPWLDGVLEGLRSGVGRLQIGALRVVQAAGEGGVLGDVPMGSVAQSDMEPGCECGGSGALELGGGRGLDESSDEGSVGKAAALGEILECTLILVKAAAKAPRRVSEGSRSHGGVGGGGVLGEGVSSEVAYQAIKTLEALSTHSRHSTALQGVLFHGHPSSAYPSNSSQPLDPSSHTPGQTPAKRKRTAPPGEVPEQPSPGGSFSDGLASAVKRLLGPASAVLGPTPAVLGPASAKEQCRPAAGPHIRGDLRCAAISFTSAVLGGRAGAAGSEWGAQHGMVIALAAAAAAAVGRLSAAQADDPFGGSLVDRCRDVAGGDAAVAAAALSALGMLVCSMIWDCVRV